MGKLIQNTHVYGRNGRFDVLLEGDRIGAIETFIAPENHQVFPGDGGFLSPGFVDLHMHLEKALTIGERECPGLIDAIDSFRQYCENTIDRDNIRKRVGSILEQAVSCGTLALRTHVSVDDVLGTLAVETMLEIKEEYRDLVDLQIIVMLSGLELTKGIFQDMEALGTTNIDGFGSAPSLSQEPCKQIDQIFDLAMKYDKLVDLHADEHDLPDVKVIDYFARKIIETGMVDRCTGGHLCALSAVDEEKARETIGLILKSGMNVVTLPSCNLYLMGRQDQGMIRRGTTRIRELYDAGINIALASDNIRDPFRPFGNGDILEEMLLTAQVAQMGTFTDLEKVYRMGTFNPARAMGLTGYGVDPGCQADLVLIQAESAAESILSRANRRYVFKKGRLVYENRKEGIKHY